MSEVRVSPPVPEISVSLGDEVVVQLPENATTGYLWSVERVDGPVRVADDAYEPPGEPLPGAGGQRFVRIRPTGAGEAVVELALKRPWEDRVQDRVSVRITVAGTGTGTGTGTGG
ncbi:protease inhibitor I42 family protein [Streptomyces sp. NPDC048277]|uniref:protease inhibitor I42 family protein n=1 Tax=Streptomyces sp. NPDC048277 TaxID=3155027 RepID=UPI0033F53E02